MKTLRYYCEHCGREVRRDAVVCPYCGRFFTSVKCPKCGYSGRVEEFRRGCPVCGSTDALNPAPEPFKPPPQAVGPLPLWVYVAVGLALILILVLLLRAMI